MAFLNGRKDEKAPISRLFKGEPKIINKIFYMAGIPSSQSLFRLNLQQKRHAFELGSSKKNKYLEDGSSNRLYKFFWRLNRTGKMKQVLRNIYDFAGLCKPR